MATIWTQDDINKLKAAVASGVLTVSYSGPPARLQTYQSLAEMRSLLADMVRQVNGGTTFRLVKTCKGL
ncbi:MAG TPA: hypothetical protein VIV58_27760 [Kofleriaceae bacterium]